MPQEIQMAAVDALKPYQRNARTHSKSQIEQIAKSIQRFGFTNPILVDGNMQIIAGHGRVEAAKLLGLKEVPIICIDHFSEADIRAYILADNRLAEKAGWDNEILAVELQALLEFDFDLTTIGFEPQEVDAILVLGDEANPDRGNAAEDAVIELAETAVCGLGDIWQLGRHRLICADARDEAAYKALTDDEPVHAVFADPPFNVAIGGHARVKEGHREFAMASGEMSKSEFTDLLTQTLSLTAKACRDGAIAFVCMDWRHMDEMLRAGAAAFTEFKSLCVWTKTNGGMGSLYRSQHELVFVYKVGQAAHINNVQLGKHGRNRTTVWPYAGVNAFKTERDEELSMHPTVKPVALVEDAIRDVTHRNHILLDPFGGSGTTLIAAQKCGRQARLIEIDPLYCDVILRRFIKYTGKQPVLIATGETFEDCEANRSLAA